MNRHFGPILALHWAATLLPPIASPQQSADGPALVDWARTHGTSLTPAAADCKDLDALAPRIADARVIALGELIHDAHELHLLGNRFARCLGESGQITAIALESGLADMVPLQQALLQSRRSVAALTRERISYGWGGLPEVQTLTESIRAHNSKQPPNRRIRLYGIDVTGADGSGNLNRAGRSIEELVKYLAQLGVPQARRLSDRLKPFAPRISESTYASVPPNTRDSLRTILDSAEQVIRHPAECPARCVAGVRQVLAYLDLKSRLGKQPRSSPEFSRLVTTRDSIMADNLLWALGRQPTGGRVLLLAHNGHVFVQVGPTTLGPQINYTTMGQRLRAALGTSYAVIGTDARALGYYLEEQHPPPEEHLGSMFGRLGSSWLLLDLQAAAQDPELGSWLEKPRRVRINWGFQWIRPALATDLLIIVDSLSPTFGEIR